jgi:stress-induced morphogen
MDAAVLKAKLAETFSDGPIKVSDMTGGGDHWQVEIVSTKFAGLTLVEQHQLVYKTLGDWMKREIHALALKTSAPA